MSAFRRIAVLDIGKTNAKVVVIDCESGDEVAERRMPNRVIAGPPYPHYDIEALWTFICKSLSDLATAPGYDAVSITTHGAAAAVVDMQGSLVLPVIDYEHRYPVDIEQAYAALRPPFAETFSPPLTGGLNLGAQLHYQKTAFPAEFAHAHAIITYPQYWAFRLTGVLAGEMTSLGCHSDLWLPREGCYSSLVDTLGIRQLMPPVRSAFDALGVTTQRMTRILGLAEPIPVFCGIHDSNASLLPHLVDHEPPLAVVSTGTWVVCFAVGGSLEGLDPARDCLANVDAYGRAVPSSRFMGGREFELLAAELGPFDADAAFSALPSVIARETMLLPNIVEGSGPFRGHRREWLNDEDATGSERWAAACLYLALMTETSLALIGAKGPALVEGPFAANPVYLAILQTLIGRSVISVGGSTGTTQGAALLAGVRIAASGRSAAPVASIPDLQRYREDWKQKASSS